MAKQPLALSQQGKSITELFQKYQNENIYILGTGPSLFKANPEDFKDRITFGINYSFEVIPYIDYILVHTLENYEIIRKVVDNSKLILSNTLVTQVLPQPDSKNKVHRISVNNQQAFFYSIQNPYETSIDRKHVRTNIDADIFTWSTTTHSAIHLAAYMGAKTICLIGVDYELYPNRLVHFNSKYARQFSQQKWHAHAKHKEGELWLAKSLKKAGIRLINLSKQGISREETNIVSKVEKEPNKMLSVCLTVFNRSKLTFPDGQIATLLPNCLRSVAESIAELENLEIEIVISDFGSTDWPLEEWIVDVLGDISYQIIKVKEQFHSGFGRNIAADHARGDYLLFLDADMIVPPSFLKNGLKYLRRKKVYFPICFYYLNSEHTLGFWCDGGKGISFMPKSLYEKVGKWPCPPSYKLAYNIDQAFFKKIKKSGVEIINHRENGLFHQYHPGRSVDVILKRRKHLIEKADFEPNPNGQEISKPQQSDENSVSVCLLSYKRPENIQPIINSLHALKFVDEILVWNNQPAIRLQLKGAKVRVINSLENLLCYGRFLCAKEAKNEIIYVQDDDAIVKNISKLYSTFLKNSTRITHGLFSKHYLKREQYKHFYGQVALVGWGAFFKKSWLKVLDDFLAEHQNDYLFRREADQIFTLLLDLKHYPIRSSLQFLDHHSKKGIALYRQPSHFLYKALAVRKALAFNRKKREPKLPVTWNVVIPCKNYGKYLEEAVISVLHNAADYVITIVDDHSDDNTMALGQRLANKYSFINYIRHDEPRGVSCARNLGIASVDSLFVVLLDADDKIGANYLFEAEKLLRDSCDVANPEAILFGTKKSRWEVPETVTLSMLLGKNYVHTCAAFRRSFWSEVGGIDENMKNWQDYEFWIRLAAAGARIKKLPGDHFYYRKHGFSKSTESHLNRHKIMEYIRAKHKGLFDQPILAQGSR